MDVFDAIARRRSYRGRYRYVDVPRRDLIRIVQAGLDAPSGRNHQTTSFVIVEDRALLTRIGELKDAIPSLRDARAMIACVIDRQPHAIATGETFEIEDCAAAVENMLLAITALGYASCWLDGWLRRDGNGDQVSQMLGLPDYKVVRVLLPIGIAADAYEVPVKKPFDQRAWFDRFGG
jgi:nitroreductase